MARTRITGLSGLKKDLRQVQTAVREGTDEAVQAVNKRAAESIAQDAPVDTGRLQRSVHAEDDGVHIDADYWPFVNRRRNFIQPTIAKVPDWLEAEAVKDIEKGFPT